MKIVIDLYDLGFKLHDLTEDEINKSVKQHPEYRDRVYFWDDYEKNRDCKDCAAEWYCNSQTSSLCYTNYLSGSGEGANNVLKPYFKRR